MNLNFLLFASLVGLCVLYSFVTIPEDNIEIVKMILTALIAATTGGAIGYAIGKDKANEKADTAGSLHPDP